MSALTVRWSQIQDLVSPSENVGVLSLCNIYLWSINHSHTLEPGLRSFNYFA